MTDQLQIGFVLFPRVTQLDFTGPLQVVSRVPNAQVHLIWKRIEPVSSDTALTLNPTITFADCPQLDVICVPGGIGTDDMVNDEEVLAFLRKQAAGAKFITSVCTGSLVRGAAACSMATAPPRIGARSTISPSSVRRRSRRGCASTVTALPAAASPRASTGLTCSLSRIAERLDDQAAIQSGSTVQCQIANSAGRGARRRQDANGAMGQRQQGDCASPRGERRGVRRSAQVSGS